jgi:hypothetical protein
MSKDVKEGRKDVKKEVVKEEKMSRKGVKVERMSTILKKIGRKHIIKEGFQGRNKRF